MNAGRKSASSLPPRSLALSVAFAVALSVPFAAAASPSSAGANARLRAAQSGVPRFKARRAIRHVRRLSNHIGVRVRATGNERRAARHVARTMRRYGYNVRIARFGVDGGTSRNVVARWPGSRRRAIVIGAHMDTVAGSPGANDNASGVAVMLELARLFAGRAQARRIRFIAFGSEEYGLNGRHHVGSRVYVRRIGSRGRRRIAGMVSVDMVADGRPLIVGTAGMASPVVARTMLWRLRRARVDATYRITCDCSDNGPFERAGIPAAFVWSGDEPNYHSPSDTLANLSRRDLRRTGRALRAFVNHVGRRMLRRFFARR